METYGCKKIWYDMTFVRRPARPRKEQFFSFLFFFFRHIQIQVFSFNYFVTNCYSPMTPRICSFYLKDYSFLSLSTLQIILGKTLYSTVSPHIKASWKTAKHKDDVPRLVLKLILTCSRKRSPSFLLVAPLYTFSCSVQIL